MAAQTNDSVLLKNIWSRARLRLPSDCVLSLAYFGADARAPAGLPCRVCRSVLIAQLLCDLTVWFPDVTPQVFGSGKPSAERGNFKKYSEHLR